MKAAKIGAPGLVGQHSLKILLESERYDEIHSISRNKNNRGQRALRTYNEDR